MEELKKYCGYCGNIKIAAGNIDVAEYAHKALRKYTDELQQRIYNATQQPDKYLTLEYLSEPFVVIVGKNLEEPLEVHFKLLTGGMKGDEISGTHDKNLIQINTSKVLKPLISHVNFNSSIEEQLNNLSVIEKADLKSLTSLLLTTLRHELIHYYDYKYRPETINRKEKKQEIQAYKQFQRELKNDLNINSLEEFIQLRESLFKSGYSNIEEVIESLIKPTSKRSPAQLKSELQHLLFNSFYYNQTSEQLAWVEDYANEIVEGSRHLFPNYASVPLTIAKATAWAESIAEHTYEHMQMENVTNELKYPLHREKQRERILKRATELIRFELLQLSKSKRSDPTSSLNGETTVQQLNNLIRNLENTNDRHQIARLLKKDALNIFKDYSRNDYLALSPWHRKQVKRCIKQIYNQLKPYEDQYRKFKSFIQHTSVFND